MAPIARSKLTAEGQVFVPAAIRRRLGVGPGDVLEWDDRGDAVVVRRAGRYTSEEVHRALFPRRAPRPPERRADQGGNPEVRAVTAAGLKGCNRAVSGL
jgi:AbrB family looped-hinge helix DNA binding protein